MPSSVIGSSPGCLRRKPTSGDSGATAPDGAAAGAPAGSVAPPLFFEGVRGFAILGSIHEGSRVGGGARGAVGSELGGDSEGAADGGASDGGLDGRDVGDGRR